MLLFLILAIGSWAGEVPPPASAAHPVTSACACVSNKVCWNLMMTAYAMNLKGALTEVEAALPNRFAPGTEFSVLRKPDKEGHFLSATCGPRRAVCTGPRDVLEKNLVLSRFLASLPLGAPEGVLFDPTRWTITDQGESTIAESRRCKPDLLRLLAAELQK